MVTKQDYYAYCNQIVCSEDFQELVSRNLLLNIYLTKLFVEVDKGTELYQVGVRRIYVEFDVCHSVVYSIPYIDKNYLLSTFVHEMNLNFRII